MSMSCGTVVQAENDAAVLYLAIGEEELRADRANMIGESDHPQHLEKPIIGENFRIVIQEEHERCLYVFHCAIDEIGEVEGFCGNIQSSHIFLFQETGEVLIPFSIIHDEDLVLRVRREVADAADTTREEIESVFCWNDDGHALGEVSPIELKAVDSDIKLVRKCWAESANALLSSPECFL